MPPPPPPRPPPPPAPGRLPLPKSRLNPAVAVKSRTNPKFDMLMAAAQLQGSSHNNSAFKATNFRVTRSVQEQAAALEEELLNLERAKQEVLMDIAEVRELQRLTLLAGMTVPPDTSERNRKKALNLSKSQIAASGGFAQWGSMLKAKLQHLEKVKGTIEKVERILKRLGPQALLARNAGVSLNMKGKLEAEITTWMDHLQKYEHVLKSRNDPGGAPIRSKSFRPQMVSTSTSMPEQKLATIAITVAQSCNGASGKNSKCNRTLSSAKALLKNTNESKVVAEVAGDLSVIKEAAPRRQESMIRTSTRGGGKRARVMLTALMLLGLVSGSGYLLSNATAIHKHAPNTRNLSTIMPLGNVVNARTNGAVPVLNLYNGQVFDANALKLVDTRNASHIAVPNYVTDSFNAYGGANDHANVFPNNSHVVAPKRENTLYPAALSGVLVGGIGAAAAGRMLNKRSMKNAHVGKKGKKKKMNGVLRNLLDAPVSAGVRSRQR